MNTVGFVLVIWFANHGGPATVDSYQTFDACRIAGNRFVFDATQAGLRHDIFPYFSCVPRGRK